MDIIYFVTYTVGFVMGHNRRRNADSKELRICKLQVRQLEEEREKASKFFDGKYKVAQRYIEVLRKDNAALKRQVAYHSNSIRQLGDYLKHILAYTTELQKKTTLRHDESYDIGQQFYGIYQDILAKLTDIVLYNRTPTSGRRDSRGKNSATEKNNLKALYLEERTSNKRLNVEAQETQLLAAKAKRQVEAMKQEKSFVEVRMFMQKKSWNEERSCFKKAYDELMAQYKNLLANYSSMESHLITSRNEIVILANYNDELRSALGGKSSYVSNLQKVLTSFSSLRYLVQDENAIYNHQVFVRHVDESVDSTERIRFFEDFLVAIRSAVQERALNVFQPSLKHQPKSSFQNLNQTVLTWLSADLSRSKEQIELKYKTLQETARANEEKLLDEYNKACLMYTDASSENVRKTRELQVLHQTFEAFKVQTQTELTKSVDELKYYQAVHEQNSALREEIEIEKNQVQDLMTEKDDLVYKCSCLEEEVQHTQNQLSQYKNPDLMPSYQDILKLYTEVKNVVDEAELREKECAEKNHALAERTREVTAENQQLRSKLEIVTPPRTPLLQREQESPENLNQLVQFYARTTHYLELDNLKLLKSLENKHTAMEYFEFQQRRGAKVEIEAIEDWLRNGESWMSLENLSMLKGKYKEFIAALERENERLRQRVANKAVGVESIDRLLQTVGAASKNLQEEDDGSVLHDDPYVNTVLRKIARINRSIAQLEARVDKFRGTRKDKEYLDLEHKLTDNIINVDVIQVEDNEVIRAGRRDAIMYAKRCLEKLDANLVAE